MVDFLLFYIISSLAGWLTFPLAYRMLSKLPDKGYSLARPLGLLLWGYIFWMLASLHVIKNDVGGVFFSLILLLGINGWLLRGSTLKEIRSWLVEHKRYIITSEALFLLVFAGWAYVRAMNPDIAGTEKPMELAFINAILRSDYFPPHDPWLSGYAISYYYFGYVLVAMLIQITGVFSGIAFNLAIAYWFALSALAAYGIIYCLFIMARKWHNDTNSELKAAGWGLLGPFYLLIVSNIEGFLEMLHARGLFWVKAENGILTSSFWNWLNINELTHPPSSPFTWIPQRIGGIWWWRASRVLQDFDLQGQVKEIIDEFPFFSYLLADLHPHLLAMPFVLLAIGLALNFYLGSRNRSDEGLSLRVWFRSWYVEGEYLGIRNLDILQWLKRQDFWLAAIILGGLAFLNTWDFPIYVAFFSGVYVLSLYLKEGWNLRLLGDFFKLVFLLGIFGAGLYFPFYLGFASQAGGILPSLSFYTRGVYFWIMFGSLLLPVIGWLVWSFRKNGKPAKIKNGIQFALCVVLGLWVFSYLLGWLFLSAPLIGNLILNNPGSNEKLTTMAGSLISAGDLLYGMHGSDSLNEIIWGSLGRRFAEPGTWITLLILLAIIWSLFGKNRTERDIDNSVDEHISQREKVFVKMKGLSSAFVISLVFLGTCLVLIPEFIYLRDQFGWRMNTIFKFYFQVWIVWSLAAAFGSAILWNELKKGWRFVFGLGWSILVAMSLAYPVFGLWTKTDGFQPEVITLDGTYYMSKFEADDMDAINWLRSAPLGVVAEAVGGSYSGYARVATFSGQPTVLGWPGHESQWRGGSNEIGSRESDIKKLYNTTNWNEAQSILSQYQIRYVFIGSLEMSTYKVNEKKFIAHLKPVYQNASVKVYEVPPFAEKKEQASWE